MNPMTTEKLKIKITKPKTTIGNLLRTLKSGDAIRIKTANGYRNAMGSMHSIGKKIGVRYATLGDGDDVLIYIKPKNP